MMHARQLFLRHIAQTSPSPLMLEIDHASGIYLYDHNGKAYIDLIAGISVSAVGHCHPAVVTAVKHQVERYMHTLVYGEYVLTPQVELAQLLCSLLPEKLDTVYFTASGTEATEGAMKLAKRHTGRSEIISCTGSYHGSTQGALSLMGDENYKSRFRPLLPGIRHIRYGSFEDLEQIGKQTAAVFIEPVQAESGVLLPPAGWLSAIRERCDNMDALLVFDEIQTGCGRTGSMFAFESEQVVPDILLLAKGLGGGMPIGAFISPQSIMQSLSHDPVLGHITTFGGHPVCCAAALATLQILRESNIISEVANKSALFLQELRHPAIQTITCKGLLMALHLGDSGKVQRVIEYCLTHGLVTDWFLFAPDCIRIAPPLIISEAEIKMACATLMAALDTLNN